MAVIKMRSQNFYSSHDSVKNLRSHFYFNENLHKVVNSTIKINVTVEAFENLSPYKRVQ